jgi:hypothetical protein
VISQADLALYRKLKDEASEAESRAKAQRDKLVAEFGRGVEPGPLTARLETRVSRSFSYEALVDLVTRPTADYLRDRLPARESQVLAVVPA